jgi:hypothetical protein
MTSTGSTCPASGSSPSRSRLWTKWTRTRYIHHLEPTAPSPPSHLHPQGIQSVHGVTTIKAPHSLTLRAKLFSNIFLTFITLPQSLQQKLQRPEQGEGGAARAPLHSLPKAQPNMMMSKCRTVYHKKVYSSVLLWLFP